MDTKLTVAGPAGAYRVGKRLGSTDRYNLYLCQPEKADTPHILKVAAKRTANGILDREAFLLRDMREQAQALEVEYAAKGGTIPLNYQLCFPNLVETFIGNDQEGRRISIINFNSVPNLQTMVPIGRIRTSDHVRVDPKTSAWMMGKLLKALVFAHDQRISVGFISGENILIERKEHYVTIFDWTKAKRYTGQVPKKVAAKEISQAAIEVIRALGGDPATGVLPEHEQLADDRYAVFLQRLARGAFSDAGAAHTEFYALIRELWPREYYPFTTLPL